MRKVGSCALVNFFFKACLQNFKLKHFLITGNSNITFKTSIKKFNSCSLWFALIRKICTLEPASLELVNQSAINHIYKKFLFHFHYSKIELYVVILRLAYMY